MVSPGAKALLVSENPATANLPCADDAFGQLDGLQDDRSATGMQGFRFPPDVTVAAVRWYLRGEPGQAEGALRRLIRGPTTLIPTLRLIPRHRPAPLPGRARECP